MSAMTVTSEQIAQAEAFDGPSIAHDFTPSEQADYDCLRASGRSLYDALRTLHHTAHERAFCVALVRHGRKRVAS